MTKNMTMRWDEKRYYSLDYYLKQTYGEKLYKIALDVKICLSGAVPQGATFSGESLGFPLQKRSGKI